MTSPTGISEENRTQIYRINADHFREKGVEIRDELRFESTLAHPFSLITHPYLNPDNLRKSASHNFLYLKEAGFTLIELLAVILILGIILLLSWPDLAGVYRKEALRSASRQIASTLSFARSSSVSRKTDFEVSFDLDQGCYWVSEEENRKSSLSRQRSLPEGVAIKEICLASGRVIAGGLGHISFSPQGRATNANIYLIGTRGDIYTVQVKRTGRVKIYEGAQ